MRTFRSFKFGKAVSFAKPELPELERSILCVKIAIL